MGPLSEEKTANMHLGKGSEAVEGTWDMMEIHMIAVRHFLVMLKRVVVIQKRKKVHIEDDASSNFRTRRAFMKTQTNIHGQ